MDAGDEHKGVPWAGERGDVWGNVTTRRPERHLGEIGVRLEAQPTYIYIYAVLERK